MKWRRRIAWILGSLLAFLLVVAVSLVLIVRSDWFYNQVRLLIVSNVETATALGIGKSAASSRYLRALKRLKDILASIPGLLED